MKDRPFDFNSAWIFVQVIQTGSFSAAARQLQMPVSTVSTKISQLEERLGVSLIRRTTRKLQLTEAGTRYFEHAILACAAIQEAEATTSLDQEEASGLIRVTAPIEMGSTSLTDVIADFLERFPKVQVELLLTDRMVDLISEGIDLAVRVGKLEDSSLVARRIGATEFQAYASPAYLKRKGEPRHPNELKTHACLSFQDSVSSQWELASGGKTVSVSVKGPASTNNLISLHRLTLHHRGIALLPSFLCIDEVENGRLKQVLKGWKTEHYPVHLVHPQQKYIPKKVRILTNYIANNMSALF